MKKLIIVLMLIMVLGAGAGSAYAADLVWQEDMGVIYDGETIESNTDITAAVSNLKPGNSMTFSIKLENGSENDMAWWLNDSLIDNLRKSTSESGGAMTYELYYEGRKLFANAGGEGGEFVLPGEESMPGYIYLDEFKAGSFGYIDLTVYLAEGISGEAADHAPDLGMSFALESLAVKEAAAAVPSEDPGMGSGVLSGGILFVMAMLLVMELKGAGKKTME